MPRIVAVRVNPQVQVCTGLVPYEDILEVWMMDEIICHKGEPISAEQDKQMFNDGIDQIFVRVETDI